MMIQEILPHRFNNRFVPGQIPGKNDYIFYYCDNTVLLKTRSQDMEIPRLCDFSEKTNIKDSIFLFTLNNTSCFLLWNQPSFNQKGFSMMDIHFFRTSFQKEIAWACLAGLHLRDWYQGNRFCGHCGSVTHHKSDERAMVCPVCHTTVYPKISPAIIVAILCGDRILLARGSDFPDAWYSLIAGYADIGESLEEALIREVKEEVGLDVRKIRYYGSQPWPLSGSMMIGFVAEAEDHLPLLIDRHELVDAAWFSRGNLPRYPLSLSIAGEMIEKFEQGTL
jgi:NAD+ diphosphatase